MSITDELREYANRFKNSHDAWSGIGDDLTAIADRIDEQHKHSVMSAMNDALYHANDESMSELGWVRLPKDADGVSVHVGDELVDEKDRPVKVRVLKLRENGWLFDSSRDGGGMLTTLFHHVQPDSWERIIQDALTVGWHNGNWNEVASADIHDRLVERCRRLAGEE